MASLIPHVVVATCHQASPVDVWIVVFVKFEGLQVIPRKVEA